MIFGETLIDLDAIRASDLGAMFLWRNDPLIWQWCRQESLISWESHINWFNGLVKRDDVRMFAIRRKGDKQLLGVCGLTDINKTHQRAEFSCYVGPEHHRKGYATAALETLFTHGFTALNLHMIWGETFFENPAGDCFDRIGMHFDGLRRDHYFKNGKFLNAKLYSVRRDEWLQ